MAGLEVERWLAGLTHDLGDASAPPAAAIEGPRALNAAWVAEQRVARLMRLSGEYDGEYGVLPDVRQPGRCTHDLMINHALNVWWEPAKTCGAMLLCRCDGGHFAHNTRPARAASWLAAHSPPAPTDAADSGELGGVIV